MSTGSAATAQVELATRATDDDKSTAGRSWSGLSGGGGSSGGGGGGRNARGNSESGGGSFGGGSRCGSPSDGAQCQSSLNGPDSGSISAAFEVFISDEAVQIPPTQRVSPSPLASTGAAR